jgi:hypothetical protein
MERGGWKIDRRVNSKRMIAEHAYRSWQLTITVQMYIRYSYICFHVIVPLFSFKIQKCMSASNVEHIWYRVYLHIVVWYITKCFCPLLYMYVDATLHPNSLKWWFPLAFTGLGSEFSSASVFPSVLPPCSDPSRGVRAPTMSMGVGRSSGSRVQHFCISS